MNSINLRLVSDFNVEPLARYLTNAPGAAQLHVEIAPYGQVYQTFASAADMTPCWGAMVWTLPEQVIPSFAKAINFEGTEPEACLDEVDHFARALAGFSAKHQNLFVATWVLPLHERGYGMLEWQPGLGIAHLLARMNLRLAEQLGALGNTYLLDAERWQRAAAPSMSAKMWYAAKVPFGIQVFEAAAKEMAAAFEGVQGRSRRLIVVDLDNTLWGGVVGETGWEGIRLGGHDHIGEAFRDFQKALLAFSNRGVQLAVVSKNDEVVAMEAIDKHPEMILRRDQFAGWRINWEDKAANIAALAEELNLGLTSVVFIDDNPAERERVRVALPEVLVPDWPTDPSAYSRTLKNLRCFEVAQFSWEDRRRTAMYAADRERRKVSTVGGSIDDWLRDLATQLNVARVGKANIPRVAQLFNKTNQLNLSTRRMTENEILTWVAAPNCGLWAVSASDRFGDMGLVGVIGIEMTGSNGRLVDFILSCRVMGRKIEETMVHFAAAEAQRRGATKLEAHYLPTPRNRPTLDVFRGSAMVEQTENVFVANCSALSSKPAAVNVTYAD